MPCVSAPPLPVKLWHWAQLVRNSSPPLAMSEPSGPYSFFVGMAGPAPSEAMYAASWSISACE